MTLPKELLCHAVTVFNRVNPAGGGEDFRYAVLRNVRIEQRIGVTQKKEGQFPHDTFKLFADQKHTEAYRGSDKLSYMEKTIFRRLKGEAQEGLWTFAEGDYLVPKELVPGWDAYGIDDLRDYEQVFVIHSIVPVYSDGEFHHWEVSGRGRIIE